MTNARLATCIAVLVVAAGVIGFMLTKRSDNASESDDASINSAENVPAAEPTMTTESIPQPMSEGFRPPPSDVAGISKPEGEPKR